ncbi:glutathione S-transferase [Oceaniserpentilla sp. 4NH20-0058]
MAIRYCMHAKSFELREVVLKEKPQAMLDISPKGTVPVMQLTSGEVIEESLEIMHFAVSTNSQMKRTLYPEQLANQIDALISHNDQSFKWALDHYKYADRYEESELFYREQAEVFIADLNQRLNKHIYLMGDGITLADLAIFPFIRQFACVDKHWFYQSHYTHVIRWLDVCLESPEFKDIMHKYPKWEPESQLEYFP